jgi:hypothetical protein
LLTRICEFLYARSALLDLFSVQPTKAVECKQVEENLAVCGVMLRLQCAPSLCEEKHNKESETRQREKVQRKQNWAEAGSKNLLVNRNRARKMQDHTIAQIKRKN